MSTAMRIALASALLLAAQVGFGGQARERAASIERTVGRLAFATIRISEPADGPSPSPAGTALVVRAMASGAAELDWLELWANDRRVGVQPAPKGGLKILTGVFAWTPDAAGTYSLVARAIDHEDRTVTSTAVDVIVAAADAPRVGPDKEVTKRPTTLGNGVGSERTREAATIRIVSAGAGTETARNVVAAERWQPGTPSRRSGPRAPSRPDVPVLMASAGHCQVVLRMHDTSGRAEGYAVYRQSRSGLGWVRVAVLHEAAAAAGNALTFTDGASPGRLHYYVTAFNERGETMSNPVALDIDSRECARTAADRGATPILKHNGPPVQEHPDKRMPKVNARISYSVEQCKNHLPGKGTNALEAILFCTPFPEYNSEGKQAYLIWSTDDAECANGKANRGADCKGLDYYVSRAETYGGHVGYRLAYTHNDGPIAGVGYPEIAFTGDDHTSYVVPPLEPYDPSAEQFNLCGAEVKYTVELVYDAGPNDPEFAHFLMVDPLKGVADWRFTCPPRPSFLDTGEVLLDVTIDTLHLAHVDDGDAGDADDIEVYGFFRLWTADIDVPVPALVLKSGLFKKVGFRGLSTWGAPPEHCATEEFSLGNSLDTQGATGECHPWLMNGDHKMSELRLCDTCSSPFDDDGPWNTNKNTIRIAVREGEAVYIETLLMDYDSGSADDPQCVGVVNTERHLLETWAKADLPLTMTQEDNGNSSCTVTFRIAAVK